MQRWSKQRPLRWCRRAYIQETAISQASKRHGVWALRTIQNQLYARHYVLAQPKHWCSISIWIKEKKAGRDDKYSRHQSCCDGLEEQGNDGSESADWTSFRQVSEVAFANGTYDIRLGG